MIIPMTDIERKLTEDHLSIVAKVIQTLTCGCRYVSYDERQDLLQIGNLALCKAAMNYDGNRSGTSLNLHNDSTSFVSIIPTIKKSTHILNLCFKT